MVASESLQTKAAELLGRMDPRRLAAVVQLLEVMVEQDDASAWDQDVRDLAEGRQWFAERGGKGVPMEDVLADFGLTLDDFPPGK